MEEKENTSNPRTLGLLGQLNLASYRGKKLKKVYARPAVPNWAML